MHAANAIFGCPARAMLMLVIKSPISLPHANTVIPINESLTCAIVPKDVKIATTSNAQVEIMQMEPIKLPKIANNCD